MDRPSEQNLVQKKKEEVAVVTYPRRFDYEGDGGLMRLTGGVKPWEYSDNQEIRITKGRGWFSESEQTEKGLERLERFFRDVD